MWRASSADARSMSVTPMPIMVMADGRRLALTDVDFSKGDYWGRAGAPLSACGLRGGADALAAFLNTPLVGADGCRGPRSGRVVR